MDPAPNPASKRRTGPFGPAGEILPANQGLVKFKPDDNLFVALERLCEAGFNQAPIVTTANECVGVLRPLGVLFELLNEQWFRDGLKALNVSDFLERERKRKHKLQLERERSGLSVRAVPIFQKAVDLDPRYKGVNEWVDVDLDWQDDDVAMVGTKTDLIGILTATDILGRLTDFAQAFVFLEEIELDTRELLTLLLPLPECIDPVIAAMSKGDVKPPRDFKSYDQLSFSHYGNIFGASETAKRLQEGCESLCEGFAAKMQSVGKLRNEFMHFRSRATNKQVNELEIFKMRTNAAVERARMKCQKVGAHSALASGGDAKG
jgi:CBS domain-containing protein